MPFPIKKEKFQYIFKNLRNYLYFFLVQILFRTLFYEYAIG